MYRDVLEIFMCICGVGGGGGVHLTKYYQGDQIMTNKMGGACGIMGERRGEYKILMERPGRKRKFVKLRSRREDTIKIDLKQ